MSVYSAINKNVLRWKICTELLWSGHSYLLTGEIAMHLLYGFNPLIRQYALQQNNYISQSLDYFKIGTLKRAGGQSKRGIPE